MNERLYLHVPDVDEMWYRRRIMMDPATMEYNKGLDICEGYDPETGCVNFPQSQWQGFCDRFVDNEPERFFAFIARRADLEFVGQVSLEKNDEGMEISILVEDQYRRQGYATEAMELVLQVAFEVMKAEKVENSFNADLVAAVKLFDKAGFRAQAEENGKRTYVLTKEEYGYNPQPVDF